MTGTRFELEVQPRLPDSLAKLETLANDLRYSWDRQTRGLFYHLDRDLWESCGHNPKVFLRRVSQKRLEEAEKDPGFMQDFNRAVSGYETYLEAGMRTKFDHVLDNRHDLVAYFCAEFGFHESFPIYSGGLGILAGDHCKAASDICIPFIAVGLLYRKGYFTQSIDAYGNQVAHYHPNKITDLPVEHACDADGNEIIISVQLPKREVAVRVWQVKVGHIRLFLLDSDVSSNSEDDKAITYQLYGGGTDIRIKQEIVLGIGGVRALRAMGISPNVWHINEGHAAFQIVERSREYVEQGMDFDAALELTASGTVFTTHTPVAAGHDIFTGDLITSYFSQYVKQLNIDIHRFKQLGAYPASTDSFNMTALALRGTRFHNGVSKIHGGVASRMESYVWPQIPPKLNPISHVTNGVHLQTFLAREWVNLFDMRLREWRNNLLTPDYWDCIDDIPDHRFWSLRRELKTQMLADVYRRVLMQHKRNGCSQAHISAMTREISTPGTDALVLGFARRFATYKRATLLFSDPERLARLLNMSKQPVIIVFAGKAHPEDEPGQQLIRSIHEYSQRPEFIGKIIIVEGYDMSLARKLVAGVDVWLNTPQYPLEASGTSGEKAGINGVLNLSVLDGWWGEGYDGENGWAITPHGEDVNPQFRDQEEAGELLNLLEHEVIPLYFKRDHQGYSEGWVKKSKASMKTLIPHFSAERMVTDYVMKFYSPAKQQFAKLSANNGAKAIELVAWKKKIAECWSGVSLNLQEAAPTELTAGEQLKIRVTANLNGLQASDVVVECLLGHAGYDDDVDVEQYVKLESEGETANGNVFAVDLDIDLSGLLHYQIRMYPHHPALSRRFETGYMIWL